MTPERWKQVEDVYHAALELPLSERSGFLDQACANDEELRHEVTSLLVAQDKANSFIESYPDDVAAGMMIAEDKVRSMIGRTLGRYRLLSLIGAGGMGEVYRGSDTRLDRDVAVKILPEHLAADQAALRRFEREAKAVAALSHPNILAIFDFGSEEGVSYAVMELLEGQTLRSSLQAGSLGWQRTTEIGGAISEGLAVAHARGIIHRDLKPENIFLTADGNVKILDFGIAKLKRPVSAAVDTGYSTVGETTAPGVVIGTLSYMSPEQVRGDVADAPSDIFSMGSLLYEMTSGVRPFARATEAETIAAILKEEPAPLARAGKEVPAEFERVIRHCLEKRADDRYQSARDLAVDLRALLRGTGHSTSLDLEAKLQRADRTEAGDEATRLKQPLTKSSFADASPSSQESLREQLEPVGGAVPLGSKFYIVRPTDDEFRAAIARQDSIVLVKGARQVGKTSLLARGLQQARGADAKVILTDFQELTAAYLESVETLILTLAESFADQLELDVLPEQMWKPRLSPGSNFERYLRREVFARIPSPIVWGMDEVDRLFTCDFGSEVFGMFRAWHNKRALDPAGPWSRFTLAIAYATEAHLFITDLNQSPFNVGTRLVLDDFSFDQVADVNKRYGSPLRDRAEVARYFRLVGGHPYLVRRGLHEIVTRGMNLAALEAQAAHDEGPFGDHLRRLVISLTQDAELCDVVREVLQGQPCPTPESFYRLRSAGLMSGDSASDVRPRCQLYATYLEEHLL